MTIVIPYHNNPVGLTALLCQLQPQLKSTDILYVIDTSGLSVKDYNSGYYLTNLYTAGKHTTLVDTTPGTVYESWNAGIDFFVKHPSEGVLFLNDDIVISQTFIINLKRAIQLTDYEAYVPRTSDKNYITHSVSKQFQWYNQTLTSHTQVVPTKWMVGSSFLLTPEAIRKRGHFSTEYQVWYGDDEYQKDLKIGEISIEYVHHFVGRSHGLYRTPEIASKVKKDEQRFKQQL